MILATTVPLILAVVLVLFYDDIVRDLQRKLRDQPDEFDEETTLDEWRAQFPERHLTLIDTTEAKQ